MPTLTAIPQKRPKRQEILRDITYFGTLWAAILGADLAGAPEPIKYLIAGLWTFVVIIGATAYFGWDRLYARRSFLKVSVFGVIAIGILIYTGYIVDSLALTTWQWLSVSGVLVVTWANLFGLLLLFMSVVAYYLSFRVGSTIAKEWEQTQQEEKEILAKETAFKATEQL
ncbi:MAG TPA: hypothetical protein VGS11_00140, partial [Candidatus Bathyarchaeia archaeon]|nr:hypothetical protein [Candidatus Bathyarchaeia archaeon]